MSAKLTRQIPQSPQPRQFKKSIKKRIIWMISLLMLVGILLISTMAALQTYSQMKSQTQNHFANMANMLYRGFEQHLNYLVENNQQFTQNELLVNAFTDSLGSQKYLPPLIENFMQNQHIQSVALVDYDAQPIFQTGGTNHQYNQSPQLRTVLSMMQTRYFIEGSLLTIISPIQYYNTTQGALIVQYKLNDLIQKLHPDTTQSYVHITHQQQVIFSQMTDIEQYYLYLANPAIANEKDITQQLGLTVSVGTPKANFYQPILIATGKVILISLLFLIIILFAAYNVANSIVNPILELLSRVRASADDQEVLCSPLGTNDELDELAYVFDEKTFNLQHQAQHDALTDLPNRILFVDRLQQAIELHHHSHQKLAVLFLDLDRFKEVNDSFGHEVGDQLIEKVAQQIQLHLHSEDTIARFGGDEFSILLHQFNQINEVVKYIEEILSIFNQPIMVGHLQIYSTCGIGVAIYPGNGNNASSLMQNADAAMNKAKQKGQNQYEFYNHDMTEQVNERINLERELRYALAHNELEVYYQPQIDMTTQKVIGLETLMRWNHPKKGLIPPDVFIPFAEEIGLIVEMDRWAMGVAMKQVFQWQQMQLHPGILSLNLSLIQLNHIDFIAKVQESIAKSALRPEELMFEITETQIMRNPEQATKTLIRLKNLGLSLAIDDFGTGHSSLSYLKNFPIDKLKIDQSFVRDMTEDKDDLNLVRAIINIAKSLEMEVIAEGVETQIQADMLVANGCHEAQGYLYSKPLNTEDCEAFLKSH